MILLLLLPVTALAAGDTAPQTLYVGSTTIGTGYWTSSDGGKVWTSQADEPEGNNYIYYDGQGTLKLHNVTIQGADNTGPAPFGSGIYAQCSNGKSVALTIELIGTNTITGNYGIYVNAEISADSNGTDASLTITGENNGSLEVSGSNHGIFVKSGTGNASLNIKNVAVTSSTNGNSVAGVYVMSGAKATNSPNISLSVDGGSLTASGTGSSDGIWFYVGSSQATGATTNLTVSENAIVDAKTGGIKASDPNLNNLSDQIVVGSGTGTNGGIVFDGTEGTVYGDVTLDESLTINQGETLTIPEGSSLNTNGNLTNSGTIINNGTLTGEVGGSGTVTPKITTDSLPNGTVGESYTATLEATGNNITWSSSGMPDGLTLNSDGTITGTPTTADTYTFTVTATNASGSASKEFTLAITSVSVTDVTLDKAELSLFTGESVTLTATVKPSDATNQNVTWSSDKPEVATVDANGKVTAVGEGNATITVTTVDGSKTATCQVTVLHSNLKYFERKEASCTEPGNIEYWYCEGCNKYFSDEAGTTEIKLEDVVIPATGHHYVNGYCTKCGHRDPDYRPDPISYYNIYVEDVCDGVEVSTSKQVVREGGSINVYVEKDTARYTFDNFKVYYKRSYYGTWDELKEGTQPGEYPIKNIWTHIYIKAEGAEEKEDPTGIESIEGVKVYTKDGSLYVQTPQREQVIIVSMSGAVVKNEEQIGLKQYHGLQPGIYIVRVGDRAYKLRLH